jgi:MFS family permease
MTGVRLTKRGFLVIMILHLTFLSWYSVISFVVLWHVVGSSAETYPMAYAFLNFIIASTLLLGSFFIHRFNKIRIIFACAIAISIMALLLLFVSNIILGLIVIFVEGAFFSIGQLVFFMYFWSLTVPEERGRAAGLAGFFSLPFSHLIYLMAQTSDFFGTIMLSVIPSSGILAIKLLRPEKKALLTTKKDEKGYRPEKRTILLYSVPWILFSLINSTLARNISLHVLQRVPSSLYIFLVVLQMTASGFGALGGGIIADIFGRRLSLGFGLTLYGISSALGGFVANYEAIYFMYVANGLGWGILSALYFFVVWGDVADKESCAKRYSIGLTISYLAIGVGFLLTDKISQIPLITSSLASCLLIFLSNIPLILAPELLSSDFRRRIKLKLYMNIVRKIGRKPSQNQG